MTEIRSNAVIALGANLPFEGISSQATLGKAVSALSNAGLVIRSVSRFFTTPCFPVGAGPDYTNAAISVATHLSAAELLAVLNRVENDFGRMRAQRWGMRTLDLDLVCYGDLVLPDMDGFEAWRTLPPEEQVMATPDHLILPHPRLQDRAFVLVPMADILPKWRHPVLGRTVSEMLADLPQDDVAAVTPI